MLWVPHKGWRVQTNLSGTATINVGTTVTTGGTSSTKGTPSELISSTTFDSYWMTVMASGIGNLATASDCCLDILTGSATEDVVIENILCGYCGPVSSFPFGRTWSFPLYTPAGTRIAAQAASLQTSTDMQVAIWLWGGNGSPPFRVGTRVATYGIGTVPNGTAITPGASGAEGSWTEITASTSANHFAVIPSFQFTNDTTVSGRSYQVDVGIGSATEQQIGHSWLWGADAGENIYGPFPDMPFFKDVPSGTRLVMRMSNSGTNEAAYDAAIHCVS